METNVGTKTHPATVKVTVKLPVDLRPKYNLAGFERKRCFYKVNRTHEFQVLKCADLLIGLINFFGCFASPLQDYMIG